MGTRDRQRARAHEGGQARRHLRHLSRDAQAFGGQCSGCGAGERLQEGAREQGRAGRGHRHAHAPAQAARHRGARRREARLLRSPARAHGRGRAGDCAGGEEHAHGGLPGRATITLRHAAAFPHAVHPLRRAGQKYLRPRAVAQEAELAQGLAESRPRARNQLAPPRRTERRTRRRNRHPSGGQQLVVPQGPARRRHRLRRHSALDRRAHGGRHRAVRLRVWAGRELQLRHLAGELLRFRLRDDLRDRGGGADARREGVDVQGVRRAAAGLGGLRAQGQLPKGDGHRARGQRHQARRAGRSGGGNLAGQHVALVCAGGFPDECERSHHRSRRLQSHLRRRRQGRAHEAPRHRPASAGSHRPRRLRGHGERA